MAMGYIVIHQVYLKDIPLISFDLRCMSKWYMYVLSACVIRTYIGLLVRLVGGSSYNKGRVEVNYNGEWGTVCDDGWDHTDASVVCRYLGFGSIGTAIGSARFGQGSGSILLDNVTCIGNESKLASCGHLGVGVTRNCSHSEDAGVKCLSQGYNM